MMKLMKCVSSALLMLLLAGLLNYSAAEEEAICSRLLLSCSDWERIGWPLFQGVYELQSFTWNSFPVWRFDDIHLYYNASNRLLLLGRSRGTNLGLGAFTQDYVTPTAGDPSSWTQPGKYPFSRLVKKWFHYDPSEQSSYYIPNDVTFNVECVSEDDVQRRCNSDVLYFNESVRQDQTSGRFVYLTHPTRERYQRVPGVYRDGRPVYRIVNGLDGHLFYRNGYWWVGNLQSGKGWMNVEDDALRPEYIANTWRVYTLEKFESKKGVMLKCRAGPASGDANFTCADRRTVLSSPAPGGSTMEPTTSGPDVLDSCTNNGQCFTNDLQESMCECPLLYTGPRCELPKDRCNDSFRDVVFPNSLGYFGNEVFVGGTIQVFCQKNYEPRYTFSVCDTTEASTTPALIHFESCTLLTTTTVTTTRTTPGYQRRSSYHYYGGGSDTHEDPGIDFDDNDYFWVRPVVLPLAILTQLFLGICLWWCLSEVVPMFQVDEEFDNIIESSKLQTEHVEKILEYYSDHSGADEQEQETAVAEIDAEYAKRKEELDEETAQKAKNKFSKKVRFLTMMSVHCFVSCWLWVVYLIGCGASQCFSHGQIFTDLAICAGFFLPICYLCVLVECALSNERTYLKQLCDVESAKQIIEKMRSLAPVVSMSAECYHWETRTRLVQYTDANGFVSTRTETYQEKVVTHRDDEVFEYNFWNDNSSDELGGVRQRGVTKIRMEKDIQFGDDSTQAKFDEQYRTFTDRNQGRDTDVAFEVIKDIPGFMKRVAAFTDRSSVPWWLGERWFWVSSLLCLTWPYRLLFRKTSGKAEYSVVKRIYVSLPEQAAGVQQAPGDLKEAGRKSVLVRMFSRGDDEDRPRSSQDIVTVEEAAPKAPINNNPAIVAAASYTGNKPEEIVLDLRG